MPNPLIANYPIPQKSRTIGSIKSTFLRNLDKTSQVVASRTSSFTPSSINHPTPPNELVGDLEENDQEDILAINQVIDNLFSDNPANSPLEFEYPPSTKNIPTTPLTPDHSPSPSPPPNSELFPNPEPLDLNPLDTHQAASSTQEAQTGIPPTNEVHPNEDQ